MPTFRRFEDIHAWQKARTITKSIYSLCDQSPFRNDYELKRQIIRASTSIMANIAEGHGRRSRKEFANFLNVARSSAIEVQSHLYVALDQRYIEQADFCEVYDLLEEVSKMTVALSKYLRAE